MFSTPTARSTLPSTVGRIGFSTKSRSPYDKAVAAEEFQVWKLTVRPTRTAVLTCEDGNGKIVFSKEIEYTDFPLDEITFYFTNNTILLPSEY